MRGKNSLLRVHEAREWVAARFRFLLLGYWAASTAAAPIPRF
jgi:hypothetical protein